MSAPHVGRLSATRLLLVPVVLGWAAHAAAADPAAPGAPVAPAAAAAPAAPASAPASTPASAPPGAADAPRRASVLPPVVVTGNPLGSRDTPLPVSVLQGDALTLQRGTTLGDTLAREPGVAQSGFGPNASRPVIRGLDGDRVRILSNAGGSVDASSLSFDHAVPIDPLVVERLEVLRGPAALLYGGSAIGGVVNAIDNRIPRAPVTALTGSADLRLGGADRERSASALLEGGNGTLAWHVDAFGRRTGDLAVPRYQPVDGSGAVLPATDRIRNSAAEANGGSVGAAWTFGSGYLGLQVDRYDNDYGTVAEADVTIRMKRRHAAIAGEWRDLAGPFRTVRLRLDSTRYEHQEVEGSGQVGTTFDSKGPELRIEAEHVPLGPLHGVVGVQAENVDFSALGEEAFVPSTRTRKLAGFALEEMATPLGKLTGGLRIERTRVSSDGDPGGDADGRFGLPSERGDTLASGSLAHVFALAPGWNLSTSLSSTGRAPTSFELYANGLHAATGTYERGNPDLRPERGTNLDLALEWKTPTSRLRIGAWGSRYSRYIALMKDGSTETVDGGDGPETVDVYAFTAVRARLAGVELEGSHRMVWGGWTLDLDGKLDTVRGTDLDHDQPLPRLPPLKGTLGVGLGNGPWLGRLDWTVAARQDRVPDDDTPTAGYGLLDITLARRLSLGGADAFAFVKVGNAFDKLAYNAAAVDTIRGLAPMAGRSVKVGLRVSF